MKVLTRAIRIHSRNRIPSTNALGIGGGRQGLSGFSASLIQGRRFDLEKMMAWPLSVRRSRLRRPPLYPLGAIAALSVPPAGFRKCPSPLLCAAHRLLRAACPFRVALPLILLDKLRPNFESPAQSPCFSPARFSSHCCSRHRPCSASAYSGCLLLSFLQSSVKCKKHSRRVWELKMVGQEKAWVYRRFEVCVDASAFRVGQLGLTATVRAILHTRGVVEEINYEFLKSVKSHLHYEDGNYTNDVIDNDDVIEVHKYFYYIM
ncbi:hypothetical protein KSP39_PZI012061 [Platanthera zijinensis]|uniref:Uncharacterized protein n=1 Tax=Platanthera zijinensis TaxID=2320716 RepID=A0AAP0BG49_9ASPA